MLHLFLALLMAPSPAAVAPTAPPPAPQGDVTVTAPRLPQGLQAKVEHFVAQVGQPVGYDQLAQWRPNFPVCVRTVGFKPEADGPIRAAVEDEARRLGIAVQSAPCSANVAVIGADDPPKAMQVIQRITGPLWNEDGPAFMRRQIEHPAPVHWWRIIVRGPAEGTDPANGGTLGPPKYNRFDGSHLMKQTRENLENVVVLVDARRIAGVTPEALGAYVTMGVFASLPSPPRQGGAPSILGLFRPDGGVDPAAETQLTAWDRAYLKGLYASNPAEASLLQNGQIEASMVRDLTTDGAAEPVKR